MTTQKDFYQISDELDITKLDLFKLPISKIAPQVDVVHKSDNDLAKRAKIRELSIRISSKVAESILDEIDEAIVAFRVEEKLVAVIRVDVSPRTVRKNISIIKNYMMEAVGKWLESEDM